MKTYRYKGIYDQDKTYKIDEAVSYTVSEKRYYLAKENGLKGIVPTNQSMWTILPEYSVEKQIDTSYTYDDLIIKETDPYMIGDGTGLYKFPKKNMVSSLADSHFHKLGVSIEYQYAKNYYDANKSNMPNITGIYIVQGDRKRNTITQGFSVASVESVGFMLNITKDDDNIVPLNQSMKLGNNANDVAFPLIGGNDYRMFPVIKITKSRKTNDDQGAGVYRMEEDSITELLVMHKGEVFDTPKLNNTAAENKFKTAGDYSIISIDKMNIHQKHIINNIETNKFCIYTPDILLDKTITIPAQLYVKPVMKLDYDIGEDLSMVPSSSAYDEHYSSMAHPGNNTTKDFLYRRTRAYNYLNMDKNAYSSSMGQGQSIYEVSAGVVQENTIRNIHGFSTRMKSIIDVFGYDYKTGGDDVSNTITQYLDSSREQLFDAGILLNRTKESVLDNETGKTAVFMTNKDIGSNTYYKEFPFGAPRLIYPYATDSIYNALPLIATNLSMRSLPYIGVIRSTPGRYSNVADVDSYKTQMSDSGTNETYSINDYSNLHNTIVNINAYQNVAIYNSSVRSQFNLQGESYKFVGYNSDWNLYDGVKDAIYRGDVFSQKTFMRCIRWDTLSDRMRSEGLSPCNYEYSWKFGQGINLYLQSFNNTYLRVPEIDTMFYPYVKSLHSSEKSAVDNFIWKNISKQYSKESWLTNTGYKRLGGLSQMYALNDVLLRKDFRVKNRIYYSNVHVGGSVIDQYRHIPIGQYMDFNFEGGDIICLAKLHNNLFSIQSYSINQHFSSQKIESATDSSSIILGDKNIISDNYRQLAVYGTQHKESITNGELGIYGVDWDKEKIWRIKQEVSSTGSVFFQCDNLVDSKIVYDLFKLLKNKNEELSQNIYGSRVEGIISTYDQENKQVLFTFHKNDDNKHTYYTLIFNERLDTFAGYLDYDVNYYMSFNNRLLSFVWNRDVEADLQHIIEHNVGDYLKINGELKPMILTFIINGLAEEQNTAQFEKEFQSHLINMCSEELELIKWETTWQDTSEQPFIIDGEFWRNPEYQEHTWRVPIVVDTSGSVGPLGSQEFNTFENNSYMKGQWLKVTLKYMPKSDKNIQFYLKNIITNFIISYS